MGYSDRSFVTLTLPCGRDAFRLEEEEPRAGVSLEEDHVPVVGADLEVLVYFVGGLCHVGLQVRGEVRWGQRVGEEALFGEGLHRPPQLG